MNKLEGDKYWTSKEMPQKFLKEKSIFSNV